MDTFLHAALVIAPTFKSWQGRHGLTAQVQSETGRLPSNMSFYRTLEDQLQATMLSIKSQCTVMTNPIELYLSKWHFNTVFAHITPPQLLKHWEKTESHCPAVSIWVSLVQLRCGARYYLK
jgi:hypothetical protein